MAGGPTGLGRSSVLFRSRIAAARLSTWRGAVSTASLLFLTLVLSAPAFSEEPAEAAPAPPAAAGDTGPPKSLLDVDIESLSKVPVAVASVPSMDMPVTSVTKEPSTVGRSAAAVFVITNEMIRRSGATCLPEVLRMAPGMDVAQINSNTWAVSCRGFNSVYANKLLVLIDGRSVYTPDYAGIYWDMQDVLLEDVERIEVVRGPGGTLWGANAVNGVISIITKKAKDTQGAYVSAGGGSQKQMLDGGRYGGRIGDDGYYRVYAKHFEQGPGVDPLNEVNDSWRQGRFGFRYDWEPDRDKTDAFTIQGDHFVGSTNNCVIPTDFALPENQMGEDLLMRWRHTYDEDTDWMLQTYYDRWSRIDALQAETVKTFDVEFQVRFALGDRHKLTSGAGFRNIESLFEGGDTFTTYFPTPYWTTNYPSQFIQDEIAIVEDRLSLILGCKLEENPYTGLEYQPTIRSIYTPDNRHSLWGAVSRAVHTPMRAQQQIAVTVEPYPTEPYPTYPQANGVPNPHSEALIAYELGYRTQATDRFSWDLALYYNVYSQLVAVVPGTPSFETEPIPHIKYPLYMSGSAPGETYGAELAMNYRASERWKLYAQYTYFQMHLYPVPPATLEQGRDPCNQVYLRSSWTLQNDIDFDLMARYVDSLPGFGIANYITMDLRLAWRPRAHLELAVVGQNLLQAQHFEFLGNTPGSPTYATEVPRGVYGTATWRY